MTLSSSALLEAVLFAAGEPLSKNELAKLLSLTEAGLSDALAELSGALSDRGLALIESKNEVVLRTAPEAAKLLAKLREAELSRDLGKAGLETLAIILYKNGATRGEIDWIRGVNSSATTRSLLMRGLILRTEDPKDRRRVRYEMTSEAFATLGIRKGSEAPRYEELVTALSGSDAKPGGRDEEA